MTPKTVMVVAGDPSGDANAADLVQALAKIWPQTKFIGAGGAKMAAAGVELSFDLTADSAIGPTDAVKNLGSFLKRRDELVALTKRRRPELVILVDSYSFTQPVAHGIRNAASGDWRPKMVRYTSPQVWASRPGRAEKMA
jgi:lipid-A-disaccharide synthase